MFFHSMIKHKTLIIVREIHFFKTCGIIKVGIYITIIYTKYIIIIKVTYHKKNILKSHYTNDTNGIL